MGAKSGDRPVPCESGLELTILINSLRRFIESYIPLPKLKYTAVRCGRGDFLSHFVDSI